MPSPSPRTWRDLPQALPARALSRQGLRRLLFDSVRAAVLTAFVVVAVGGLFEVGRLWRSDPRRLATAAKATPIKDVVVITDGVLDRAWVLQTLALPGPAGLMEIDLGTLRARLEAGGQVRTAVLTRNFPDELVVNLEERLPVVRVRVQAGAAAPRDLLVARDGVIYAGTGYPPALLDRLPHLDGVKLPGTAPDGGALLAGMEAVARLLTAAQLDAPHLYRTWEILSLERLAGFDEIIVRSREVPEAVFSRREDFTRQLARLDAVIDYARSRGGALGRVDLTLRDRVPAQLASAPAIFPAMGGNLPSNPNREL